MDEWLKPFGRDKDPDGDCTDRNFFGPLLNTRISPKIAALFADLLADIEIGVWPEAKYDDNDDYVAGSAAMKLIAFGPGGNFAGKRDLCEILELGMLGDWSLCGRTAELEALRKLQNTVQKLIAEREEAEGPDAQITK